MHWVSPFVGCEMGKFKAVLRKMPVFHKKIPKDLVVSEKRCTFALAYGM